MLSKTVAINGKAKNKACKKFSEYQLPKSSRIYQYYLDTLLHAIHTILVFLSFVIQFLAIVI